MESRGLLALRTDADENIGTGHVMRCMALGQAWRDMGGEVVFITSCNLEGLKRRLKDEGFLVIQIDRRHPHHNDITETKRIAKTLGISWMALDGYHFDEKYFLEIKKSGYPIISIDDIGHLKHYYSNMIINQNLFAKQISYSCENYTKIFRGTEYVLLRREFARLRRHRKEIPVIAKKILITMGGSDPQNHTMLALRALDKIHQKISCEIKIIIGAGFKYFKDLQEIAEALPDVHLVVEPVNMAKLMEWADIAITNAGSTTWELFYMGLPAIFFSSSYNQLVLKNAIAEEDIGITIDENENDERVIAETIKHLMANYSYRKRVTGVARALVDGKGAMRVCNLISEYKALR